jgi:FixJ family two-component response regulator/tRNA A-37 threonylcarbamoyl transferase component Bud32
MSQELSPESPVLIVDDNKDFLNSIKFKLISNRITNVECCSDSLNVITLLKKKKFSLILLDMLMPGISGIELLPQIVKLYPELPVIVLTATKEINTVFNCIKDGASDYLVKPFDTRHLITTIRHTLKILDIKKENVRMQEYFLSEVLERPESFSEIITKIREVQNFYILKIAEILLWMEKPNLVINNLNQLLEKEHINKYNIDLFYFLGETYEKNGDLRKAAAIYHDIAKFDPGYTGIRSKLERIEKMVIELINIDTERYDKIKKIGEGGRGVVYKAFDKKMRRMVALKVLIRSPNMDGSGVNNFLAEARNAAGIEHRNIVNVFDYGKLEDDYFISMEFIEGENLGEIIREKHPIPISDILIIAKQLFTALAHSHKNGVIHRDIKPGNIMITYENEVKVVDFGIALLKDESKKEEEISTYGTTFYMSPEQITKKPVDNRTDIYSAGVTLFHLVCGRVPYYGSFDEVLNQHLLKIAPPINEFRKDVPMKFTKIIEKCMAKNKKDRYQEARQVIREIEGISYSSENLIISNTTNLKIFDSPEDKE